MDETFDRLCRNSWRPLVHSGILMTGDQQEAHDLAQETLARAFERWRSVSQMHNPEAWLHRVLVNLAITRNRKLQLVRRARLAPEEDTEMDIIDLDLLRAVKSLSPSQRAVVALRYYADWSIAQVASALGKSPGTVRATTTQALAKLRRLLTEEEIDDRAG